MEKLTVKNKVLLMVAEIQITSYLNIKYAIPGVRGGGSKSYASKILAENYRAGFLKRRKENLPRGGRKYMYSLTRKGENKVDWLKEQGYDY